MVPPSPEKRSPRSGANRLEFVDSHAHLDAPQFRTDLPRVLDRAFEAGVRRIVTIGVTPSSSRNSLELADKWPALVSAAAGYHPHWADGANPDHLEQARRLAAHPAAVAVGEIGLDYRRKRSSRQAQLHLFDEMLSIAEETGKPIIVHDGQAHADVLERLRTHRALLAGGIIHCFSGDWRLARTYLDWWFFLSIPGTVTYPHAQSTRQVATKMPLDQMLVETDAPHLTPVPRKGSRNEPAYLAHTIGAIAELRGMEPAEVARKTAGNAVRALRLPHAKI